MAAAGPPPGTNVLLVPERRIDTCWDGYVATLAAAAQQAWQAAEARNVASLEDVAGRLDGICSDCHKHYGAE